MKQKNSNSKAIFNIGTNKKTFYRAVTALLFLSSLCFFVQQAIAQETTTEPSPIADQQAISVSTVGISDPKIIEQKDNIFKISFDLGNRTGVQPEVRYAATLIKKTGKAQIKIDEKIYPEVVSLGENQTLPKEITYTAPAYLRGTFQLWLTAQNSSGLKLSLNSLGKVSLNGDNQFAEINAGTCYLKVEGQTGKKKYSLTQGVDIKNDEKLIATCQIINHYDREITFKSDFKTYWRNTFGKLVKDNLEPQASVSFKAQESKEISFVLPKALDPQAYDTVLTLLEGDKTISNSVAFHYVLRGASATIQIVRLDKDRYAKGETAKLSFFWSPAADTFPGSRLGATDSGKLTAQISVADKDGRACIDTISKELTSQNMEEAWDLSIIADCVNPQISAIIKDASGKTLDQKVYAIESKNTSPTVSQNMLKKYTQYVFVIIIILLIIVLIVFYFKRRSTMLIGLFFLVGLGVFFSGSAAQAASGSWSLPGNYNWYTVSLNKDVYDPGEQIHANLNAVYTGCGNSRQDPGDAWVTINGERKIYNSPKTAMGSWGMSKDFDAESTPGFYSARVEGWADVYNGKDTCGKWNDQRCFSKGYFFLGTIPYQVRGQDCTPVNGTLSDWGDCSSTACGTSGTQTRTCDGANSCGDSTCGGVALSQTCYGPSVVQGTLSGWSACSTSVCGASGTQTRTCNGASCGGNCNGEALSQTCTNAPCGCMENCVVVNNNCSKSCGGGTKVVEVCTQTDCTIVNSKTETCNTQPCPPGYREVTPW